MTVLYWLILGVGVFAAARAMWPTAAQRQHGWPNHTRNGRP